MRDFNESNKKLVDNHCWLSLIIIMSVQKEMLDCQLFFFIPLENLIYVSMDELHNFIMSLLIYNSKQIPSCSFQGVSTSVQLLNCCRPPVQCGFLGLDGEVVLADKLMGQCWTCNFLKYFSNYVLGKHHCGVFQTIVWESTSKKLVHTFLIADVLSALTDCTQFGPFLLVCLNMANGIVWTT